MVDTLSVFANTLLLGATMLMLILGVSCIVMAALSTKVGAQAYKERIEYGFFGVSSFVIMCVLIYALM
ncbi:MAG: hypothetical protein ACJAVV_003174 [Alphaproteobacteria bacterium]|jgi:hypothetical protein